MPWGVEQIEKLAIQSAAQDYAVFEAIGLQARHGLTVLDVGCFDGVGTYLRFAPYEAIVSVLGIDPSCENVQKGKESSSDPRFAFICQNFEDFPEDQRFDIIYMGLVLEHLPDKEAALAKAYRLLNPGGFMIVKTTNDAAKTSYPDPQNVMQKIFTLCDERIMPRTKLMANTDRYQGQKCYTQFKHAGFENTRTATFVEDTAGKTLDERIAIFERCANFRSEIAADIDGPEVEELNQLLDAWRKMFEKDDYYFAITTHVAVGQRLEEGVDPCNYQGVLLDPRPVLADFKDTSQCYDKFYIRPMTEQDLGHVMRIELDSFPSPWTPLAYAMELRYNQDAIYQVLASRNDGIIGYIGVWHTEHSVQVVRIAICKGYRKQGWGRYLIESACKNAQENGLGTMMLEVRESNTQAAAFYESMGFEEIDRLKDFYTDPDEDAVFMMKGIAP